MQRASVRPSVCLYRRSIAGAIEQQRAASYTAIRGVKFDTDLFSTLLSVYCDISTNHSHYNAGRRPLNRTHLTHCVFQLLRLRARGE